MDFAGILEFLGTLFEGFDIMEVVNVIMEAVGGLVGGLL